MPDADKLRVDAHIQPIDIDQVHDGQQATLRFTTFNARTTPEISGVVSLVSAEVSQNPKTGANSYTIRIRPSATDSPR